MRQLFVFRPEPGATQTVARGRALGLDVVPIPLFEVEPIAWTAPDAGEFGGLLLTSANAVRHAGEQLEQLRALPVFAVGEATALAANVAGLGVALTGGGGVDRLLEDVPSSVRLLHLCGEHRWDPQLERRVKHIAVYRSRSVDTPAGLDALAGNVATVHSPRAANRLAELIKNSDRAEIRIAAISSPAADAVGTGWADVRFASEPTDAALLALAARLCDT